MTARALPQTMSRVDLFKNYLNEPSVRAQVKNSLRENSGAFLSSMIDLYSGDRTLQQCDPRAVAMECLKAAALNLPIVKSLGFAYVVPYKNVPTFTIGYKGLIQLAQRTGQYQTINADAVYEGELVGHNKLSGMIDLSGDRVSDQVVGYFAYFRMVNGFEKILYMTKAEVEAWMKRYSPSANSNYSPWKTEFDKMAIKTCLRRLIGTYGIMTPQMQMAITQDDQSEAVQREIAANANVIDVESIQQGEAKALPEEQPAVETLEAVEEPKKSRASRAEAAAAQTLLKPDF